LEKALDLTANEEALLDRYLLGKAAEEEQARIEERFFSDDAYFEELCAAEDGLIDDYVCNRLSRGDRERFELRLKTSREWQAQVEVSRRLARATLGPGREASDDRTPLGGRARAAIADVWGLARIRPAYGVIALGAAAILATGWAIVITGRLGSQVRELQDARGRLERQGQDGAAEVSAQRARVEELAARLRAEQERAASLEQQLRAVPGRPVISFSLFPGRQRDASPTAAVAPLVVPNGTDVRLQLDLPYGEAGALYRATLQIADGGAQVWSEDMVPTTSRGSRPTVLLRVPSEVLAPRTYDLFLYIRNAAGQIEEAASYRFTAVRP
jgi:hypothetical protein